MTFGDALALGRVSNLPTVWTNVVVGVVLSGAGLSHPALPGLLIAMTLFYIGGMYINDFFDAEIDAVERPERPIPSGRTTRRTVGLCGFGMLALGVAAMTWVAISHALSVWPTLAAVALVGAIVLYNAHHKANPLSPFIMGLCRMLVYLCAGVSIAVPPPTALLIAMAVLLCYLIGLTYVAKQENFGRVANMWPLAFLSVPIAYGAWLAGGVPLVWFFLGALLVWIVIAIRFVVRRGPGDIPRAVVSLIAGICLLDAMLVASAGAMTMALLCGGGFILTLFFQRFVPGT